MEDEKGGVMSNERSGQAEKGGRSGVNERGGFSLGDRIHVLWLDTRLSNRSKISNFKLSRRLNPEENRNLSIFAIKNECGVEENYNGT